MATPTAPHACDPPAEPPVIAAFSAPSNPYLSTPASARHPRQRGTVARLGSTAAALVAAMAVGAGLAAGVLVAVPPASSPHPPFHCPRLLDGPGDSETTAGCIVLTPDESGPPQAANWRTDAHDGQ